MKSLLILTAVLFVGSSALLQAQSIIKERSGTERKVNTVSILPNGDFQYTDSAGDSKIQSRIQKNRVLWVWTPKPKEIEAADKQMEEKQFAKAENAYEKAYEKYNQLGWDVYCIFKKADALIKQDKKSDAVKELEKLKGYKLVNPMQEEDLMNAYRLLAGTYIDLNSYDKAVPYLDSMQTSKDENNAAFSFIKRGDILIKKNEKQDAVLEYLQAVMLFPKSKERAEALFKTVQTLRELKDARATKFADMLKKDYPSDPYTKQLK